MADLSSLDVPTLQNMLNGASTYDERAAIRKAIRELRASSGPSTTPGKSSGGSYYRSGGGRPTGSSTASTKASQYQFVGSASTTDTAKGAKQPAKVVTGRKEDNKVTSAYLSQSALRSHTDNEQKRESTGKGTAFSVGLRNQDGAKSKRNDDVSPTHQIGSSKIEEVVTVLTKEVEEPNPAEESVDEVQTNSQDEFEELKNAPQQADTAHDEGASERPVEREERSEVEVDMVVSHRSAVADFSAGHSSAAEPELESDASSTISQVETQERASDRKVAEPSVDSEPSAQSSACEFEEDEEEEAIERQIQATLSYTERKELRARLRQLRKSRKERGPRASDSSVTSHSRAAPVEVASRTSRASADSEQHAQSESQSETAEVAAPTESAPAPSGQAAVSIEEVDSGCCLLVESHMDGELSPAAKSAELSPCEQQKDLASSDVTEQEDATYDDTSSQASSTMSDTSEKRFSGKVSSSGDEFGRPKDVISAAMGQSEGVSDFRTVLRNSASPAPSSKPSGAAGGEQKDFRTVLKKTEAPAPVVAGKGRTDKPKAEQKDFRGQLRKSVKTKDRSSAAPRRDVAAEQADFRTVLKKGEHEASAADKKASDSTDSSSSSSSAPRVKKATVPIPAKKPVSPPPADQTPVEDEVDGLSSSRMTVTTETEHIEMPLVTSEVEPTVSVERTEVEPSNAEPSTAERDLLNMDPLDPSLSYDERKKIRKLQRAARLRGEKTGSDSPLSSPAKTSSDAGQSYGEQRRLREEAKKQEELIRRQQRQQFAAQLNASSPQTSPSRALVRNSGAQQLLEWCRRRTVHYENIEIKDFRMSWKNGLAFAALMSSLCPGEIPYDELSAETAERNLQLAFDASENAGLQPMLDVEDMMICRVPDEKSIMTYVSSIYKHFT